MATCAINKIDSNVVSTFIAEEECLKQLPTPETDVNWQNVEVNEYSDFGASYEMLARNPISRSRQNKKGNIVDMDANAGFSVDFTRTNLNRLLQGFFFADARQEASTQPFNAAAIAITGVSGGDSEYTAASGLTAFPVGSKVLAEGFGVAANNGVKTVAVSTATALEVAETVVNEASPPATASLTLIGHVLPVGDINMALVGGQAALTSTTTDFTTLGLFPGKWVFIGGDTAGSRFANNTGFARVKSIATNQLLFDDVTWPAATESGAAKTIEIYTGDVLKNEDANLIKMRSYQLERTLGEGANDTQAEYILGCVANELTITITSSEKITAELSYVGLDAEYRTGDVGDLRKLGNRLPSKGEAMYNAANNIYRLKMAIHDDTTSDLDPLFAYVQDATITIANGVTPNKAVGVLGGFDVSMSNFEVGGSATAYFQTVDALKAARANADASFNVIASQDNSGFVFDMPLIGLAPDALNVTANEAIMLPLNNAAAENANGYTLLYQYFPYLPNIAMRD